MFNKTKKRCISCDNFSVYKILDLGYQPICNHYQVNINDSKIRHKLVLGYCKNCGLVQLINPVISSLITPKYSWIKYNEPEGHLDNLVHCLISEFKVKNDASVIGTTYKDESLLERIKGKGISNIYCLDKKADLNILDDLASLEIIQGSITDAKIKKILDNRPRSDIVIARHILEHSHNPRLFFKSLQQLCRPGGLIILEVPSCEKILKSQDHCFIWEEHISYFTQDSLRYFLHCQGFENFTLKDYPYSMENSLVAIIKNEKKISPDNFQGSKLQVDIVEDFANSFFQKKKYLNDLLQKLIGNQKRVAMFGAGHLAIKFINFYEISKYISYVIDDNSNKKEMFLPGSNLQIKSSVVLDSNQIDYCLLALSQESENAVRRSKSYFLENQGEFFSIFSGVKNSIFRNVGYD